VLLSLVMFAAAAQAGPTLTLEGRVADGAWKSGPAVAVRGQAVSVHVAEAPVGEVRWYQVFPDLDQQYKNANHPWEPDPYTWVGFGEITYERHELVDWRGVAEPVVFEASGVSNLLVDPSASPYFDAEVGSYWLQAEVHTEGKVVRSAGIEERDHRGLSPAVFRVTMRQDTSFLGELTGYRNVPGLFGSVVHQSRHYIGVDCADVLVAARARARDEGLSRNFNVAMLVSEWDRVDAFAVANGAPERAVSWGSDVRPGDLLAVRYAGSRQYAHIGALAEDADGDGLLGPADLVLHAGPDPLHHSKLSAGGFDGDVIVLRP